MRATSQRRAPRSANTRVLHLPVCASRDRPSICDRLFGAIDHDNVNRATLRVELEAQLFLQGSEDRRRIRIDLRWCAIHEWRSTTREGGANSFERVSELEVVVACQFGFVEDDASDHRRESLCEVRHGHAA